MQKWKITKSKKKRELIFECFFLKTGNTFKENLKWKVWSNKFFQKDKLYKNVPETTLQYNLEQSQS